MKQELIFKLKLIASRIDYIETVRVARSLGTTKNYGSRVELEKLRKEFRETSNKLKKHMFV